MPASNFANGKVVSNFSNDIFNIAVIGAANNTPIIPQSIPQKISERIIVTGCSFKAEPISFGSRKSPMIILYIVGITIIVFGKHVYECKENHTEPQFKCHVLMQLNDYDKLRVYEDNFHKQGFDVANKGKASITSNSNGR